MLSRRKGLSQKISAAKSGFSERSSYNVEYNKHRNFGKRTWRTRRDPLEVVWEAELVPLLQNNNALSAITLLEYLQNKYGDTYPDSLYRTLQRRVKNWRALYGPEKEVMFRQEHVLGRQGISDFTKLKNVIITINNQPYEHLLYHFRLACSGWSYIKVIEGGESFTALAEGLQEALWRLGGTPLEHRTDSLSAAFKNLTTNEQQDITTRYNALCNHYNMVATRNNPGVSHENGSVEGPHGHIKKRITQALLLRGSNNFSSIVEYQDWLTTVVTQYNRRNAKNITLEYAHLQPLPKYKTTDFTEISVRVSTSSTLDIRRCTYTVPSQLQGECLRVHLYHNRLECYLGATHVITLTRVRAKGNKRGRNINYRHVIHSLVKKPQAFRFSALRDDLLPTQVYKDIWQYVEANLRGKAACKFMVGLLQLAAETDCETILGNMVLNLINQKQIPTLITLQQKFSKRVTVLPNISIQQHTLASYDLLFNSKLEVCYG